MTSRGLSVFYLGLLGVIAGYAVFEDGGVPLLPWSFCLLALGLVSMVYWLRERGRGYGPPLGVGMAWSVALFAPYVALQVLPLPLFALRMLSPAHAQLVEALGPVMPAVHFAPLSITAHLTGEHLLRIAAYTLVFLLVRQLAGRSVRHPWAPVIPILVIAGLEAVLGLAQVAAGADLARGTYVNKNHFAGLLELALPLAVMFGLARLFDGGLFRFSSATAAIQAGAVLSVAAVIFAAILYSLSRMGFTAALFSLFAMAAVALRKKLSRRQTLAAGGCLALLFLLSFTFLPSEQMVEQFGKIFSPETTSGEARFGIWHDTLRLIRAYPVFGSGLGSYDVAFLKYQTAVVDEDFGFAHNDYLQMLAELGVAGFLIPAVLILTSLRRAVRAATEGANPNARYLGLACAGSLIALLIHSIVDFNLYIPANGLVLTWILAIAAALPLTPRATERAGRSPEVALLPKLAVALAVLLMVYPMAWIWFLARFQNDAQAEHLFCRAGICNAEGVLEANGPPAPDEAREFLRRDPAAPHRWADLGESLRGAGQAELARYCFERALALGPNIPPILWRAATFHALAGHRHQALADGAHLLQESALYDGAVFDAYGDWAVPFDEALRDGIPADRRASEAYLRYLVELGNRPAAQAAWERILARGFADRLVADFFVNYLMQQKEYDLAADAWAGYLGPRRNGFREFDWLYDGDFEAAPAGSPFDWKIERVATVTVDRDDGVAHSGSHSLRIRFGGEWNLAYSQIRQNVVVEGGPCRFEAFVRTEAVTTDQGIGFRIHDVQDAGRLDIRTEVLNGTQGWTRIAKEFVIPDATRMVEVQVVREPSAWNDSKIRGTVWIDSVRLLK